MSSAIIVSVLDIGTAHHRVISSCHLHAFSFKTPYRLSHSDIMISKAQSAVFI